MINKRIRLLLIPVLAGLLFLLVFESSLFSGLAGKAKNQKDYKILGKAISLIKNEYIEEPDPFKTLEGGFKSMVDSLDVLSAYLGKKLRIRYQAVPNKEFREPGLILYKKFGAYPQIIGIRKGSPAEEKELKTGDYISAIEGRTTLTMSMQEVNLLMKTESDDPIRLQILKPTKTEEMTIARKNLTTGWVSYHEAEKSFGILSFLQLFTPAAVKAKEELQKRILSEDLSLVLDLRNCFEGTALEAAELVNLFVKKDKIGYFANRNGPTEYLACRKDPEFEDIPLVIWTNRATFGAAEIAASVLQDLGRAKVIGQKTPGLTARQQLFKFDDGSGLLLTTEIFHLMSGETIWENGVKPDIKIKAKDLSAQAYIDSTNRLIQDM